VRNVLPQRRARIVFDEVLAVFGRAGYEVAEPPGELSARLEAPHGGEGLLLRMEQQGRIFGGTYALEVSTALPVLPRTAGLTARGKGVIRMRGVSFRARRGDEAGKRLAARLAADRALGEALANVHFERLRVEPDGRPVIRHMGGSLVWVLFPPLIKGVPLVDEQAVATASALAEFARAAGDLTS
jgi:hypothetical protein